MLSADTERALPDESRMAARHVPIHPSRDVVDRAYALTELLAGAAADLRNNGQRVRDGLVSARQCVRHLRELPSAQLIITRQQEAVARLRRMRDLLAIVADHDRGAEGDGSSRARSIAVSTLEQDVHALEQDAVRSQQDAAATAGRRVAGVHEAAEAELMLDGLIETLYALVQSAVLHEHAATELKELLNAARLMAGFAPDGR